MQAGYLLFSTVNPLVTYGLSIVVLVYQGWPVVRISFFCVGRMS